ncbi:MAG TPA: acyltransferase [Ktedonobacteraceae bacterium]|nr:acyltransferase [Ktedonobacteraceae bacterium]
MQTKWISFPWITAKTGRNKPKLRRAGKNNIAALDGVRAIAALLVVSVHVSDIVGVPWDVNQDPLATAFAYIGRTGVILFFVLSGFLLFMPYARAMILQEEWPSARKFYLRRIFRIWPGYYLTLIIMILWSNRKYLEPAYWKQLGLFLTFFMDSTPQTWQQINGPFWTLATEWQFYMLLPLIAFSFSRIVRRFSPPSPQERLKVVLSCCMGLITWGLFIRGFGVYYQRHPDMNVLVPHPLINFIIFFTFGVQGKYLEIFSFGMMISACYIFAQHPELGRDLKARLQRLSYWIWGTGIIVLTCLALWQAQAETDRDATPNFTALNFLQPLRSLYAWFGEPIAGVGYALCILAILFGTPALKWLFETRFLQWIGMLSYSLYMWHLNLMLLFSSIIHPYTAQFGKGVEDILLWAFVWLAIVPFCYLFYKLIEEPGIRLGARLTARKFEAIQLPPLKALLSPKTLLARLHKS